MERSEGNVEIRPLDAYELRRMLELGDPVTVLDCRTVDDYRASDAEIPSSVRINPDDLDRQLNQIPRGRQIVVCSDSDRDGLGERVAEALMRKGYNDVRPVKGGFQSYVHTGGPLVPRSRER